MSRLPVRAGRAVASLVGLLLLLVASVTSLPALQPTRARAQSRVGTSVAGVVHDSVVGKPLEGALVQLVSADSVPFGRTERSDSLGRFTFDEVPRGRYTIGFFHPMLDSLGLEPLLRAVEVDTGRRTRADLAIPSALRIRTAICGSATPASSSSVVMGFVRDARTGAPSVGARVAGEWVELTLGRGGMTRSVARRVTTTRESGWFALCNVPSPGSMRVMASRGADSTDLVELEVPAGGFQRRELFLGEARVQLAPAISAVAPTDSALPSLRIRTGNGTLRGTIVATVGGRPLAGAQVGIVSGPQVRANERGEFNITNAPGGTRMLEVRAVGFYPTREVVNVTEGAAPVRVAMVTFKSVLDTMKVIANYDRYSRLAEFRERSRTGLGRFLTAADIARRQPAVTTDLFRNFPGLFLDLPLGQDQLVYMRGAFTARCVPSVWLNGAVMENLSTNDIDGFVAPRDIVGIEVYSQTQAPPQFQVGMSGCGAIVIWTR